MFGKHAPRTTIFYFPLPALMKGFFHRTPASTSSRSDAGSSCREADCEGVVEWKKVSHHFNKNWFVVAMREWTPVRRGEVIGEPGRMLDYGSGVWTNHECVLVQQNHIALYMLPIKSNNTKKLACQLAHKSGGCNIHINTPTYRLQHQCEPTYVGKHFLVGLWGRLQHWCSLASGRANSTPLQNHNRRVRFPIEPRLQSLTCRERWSHQINIHTPLVPFLQASNPNGHGMVIFSFLL